MNREEKRRGLCGDRDEVVSSTSTAWIPPSFLEFRTKKAASFCLSPPCHPHLGSDQKLYPLLFLIISNQEPNASLNSICSPPTDPAKDPIFNGQNNRSLREMANFATSFDTHFVYPPESCVGSLRAASSAVLGLKIKARQARHTLSESISSLRAKASNETPGLVQEVQRDQSKRAENIKFGPDFTELEQRFLAFKKQEYLEKVEHYKSLSKSQAPKFMVIACGDSRVCPSVILGFKPGEAFIVRNVANLVPPFEGGASETNAALEFAINALEVEDILIIGHSCCGGIRALMGMQDDEDKSSFIKNWVRVGMKAKISTKAVASDLTFDQQCRHCEKESVNKSLLNLLSYPWIKEQVMRGKLSLHGAYYNFVDCTFEKWTLDYFKTNSKANNGALAVKGQLLWF